MADFQQYVDEVVAAIRYYIDNFDLDPKLVWEDFQLWANNIPPRLENWFNTLPQRAQMWPNRFSAWAQALPSRIQFFFENFQMITARKIEAVKQYFRTCNEVEYTFWAANGVWMVVVLLALILW